MALGRRRKRDEEEGRKKGEGRYFLHVTVRFEFIDYSARLPRTDIKTF